MIKALIISIIFVSFTGCGSISKFIEKQNRASKAVKDKEYNLTLGELKEGLVKYFGGWRSTNPNKRAQRIKEEIDKGFIYKKQYYQRYEPGLLDLIGALNSQEKDSFNKFFTKNSFHTIEDDKDGFKLVFDGMIYEGIRVDDSKSKIHVYEFENIKYGPYELDVNWLALLSKHGSIFSIRSGPVLLDKTMKYAKRSSLTEVDLLKTLDPAAYEKL